MRKKIDAVIAAYAICERDKMFTGSRYDNLVNMWMMLEGAHDMYVSLTNDSSYSEVVDLIGSQVYGIFLDSILEEFQ